MSPPARPVRAEDEFDQWTVRRAGLVIGRTEAKPAGTRAAECECSCGTVRVVRLDRLFSGESKSCGHLRGRPGKPPPGRRREPELPGMPRRIAAWAAGHAPGRLFSAAEVAAGLGITPGAAQPGLSRAVAAGLITRHWPGAFSLPGAGPFTPPSLGDAPRILAFIASDGGATWAELRAALGLKEAGVLSRQLERLAAAGRIVWQEEPLGRPRRFYLLPGQEPGQVIAWAGEECASAGRVSDRSRLRQRRTCGTAYPRRLFTGG